MAFLSSRRASRQPETEFDAFEIVAAQVVDVIATAGVVLDQANSVVRASPGAIQFGLVQNRRLIHAALVQLADEARTASGAVSRDIERYVMLLVDDRTDSKRLEETRRDFVANVSHELKTPIGAISLLSEAMQGAVDDPEAVQKFAESLQREAQRLANIVQELIQLSRVQGAKLSENIG
ncbi:MAG: histidine kinase dimerization/phospho-acceptor domain-containing protein [Aquiluna sp.]